jgi:two-component system, OmpR family, sensor kinase ParS
MGKLFLKLWLLVLLTSLTSFQIQKHVFNWASTENATTNANERFRRAYVLIEEVLSPFPQSQWQQRFEKIKSRIGTTDDFLGPSRLLSIRDLVAQKEFSEDEAKIIREHKLISRNSPDELSYEVFHTILGTEMVVVLQAPMGRKPPMLILGLVTTTQFTWLVESSLYALAIFAWLRLFRRDMLTLEKAAARVGEGHFDFHIDISRGAALYPLADSLNKMKERISSLMSSHKQLTNAISHEFRTPITRLRFRHELAMEAETLAKKDSELERMNTAIDQLDDLSTELLEYARLDRESPTLDIAAIDVVAWLEELVAEANEVVRTMDCEITVVAMPSVAFVDGDYRYLSRAASNLLRNAVHYAKSRVEIRVEQRALGYALIVDDDGPGIPDVEREMLFEPFSRLDQSRCRDSGGFGLGLAIVKQIARWHSGTVSISDATIGGARCQMVWKNASKNQVFNV